VVRVHNAGFYFFTRNFGMDIVQVLGIELSASLEKNKLEINSVLSNPTIEGSLDRLDAAIKNYALVKIQLDLISSLNQQMEKPNEKDLESED